MYPKVKMIGKRIHVYNVQKIWLEQNLIEEKKKNKYISYSTCLLSFARRV